MSDKPSLDIQCIKKESNDINGQFVGVNVIRGKLGETEFEFPSPAATQIELTKANHTHIPIPRNIIQYYYQNKYNNSLKTIRHAGKLQKNYEKIMKNYPTSILDINFDYVRNYSMTLQERDFIIKLQGETNSIFLTDIETNRNQSLELFKNQLENLNNDYPEKIICPTLDINSVPQIFQQKLQHVVSEGYDRFNVSFGGFITRQENWLTLSKEIFGKPIWCNVVNMQQRFDTLSDLYASNISIAFAYGIHTISVGFPRMSFEDEKESSKNKKKEIVRVLNPENLLYEETTKITKPQSYVHSFNTQQAESENMKKSVGKEFFKEYAKKKALKDHLSKIKNRV
ncbi:MAG: hypothetical protein IIA83_01200 [Thaumarchaeota archaeon]|nr:hypothetical protein [Nitrososphaerota archaeon]